MQMVEVENLECRYDGHTVLQGIELHVEQGEVLAIVGPNGAGKSTLLKAMSGIISASKGVVLLKGRNIKKLSARVVARSMAYAPQQIRVELPITVEQTVSMGRIPHRGWLMPFNKEDKKIVEQSIELVGLTQLAHKRVDELSGGELQRAILGRVLAQSSELLLLDEPTSYLDLKYQTELLELVKELSHSHGVTVVITVHDLNLAALYADRIALLGDGNLRALGRPEEVLTEENLTGTYNFPIMVSRHPVYATPLVTPDCKSNNNRQDRSAR